MSEIITDILIALAVVASIGLLMGILLALVSRFFGLPENKKLKQIRECLPGVNCGACAKKCPQHIDIPAKLREVAASFAE